MQLRKKITLFILSIAVLFVLLFCASACSKSNDNLKITSLKGPTSIGIAQMFNTYDIDIVTSADAAVSQIASGDADIVLLPANVAANIYNKNKNIKIIDINTLGVLHALSQDTNVKNAKDFTGRKVYSIGKGTVPQFVLNDTLKQSGINATDIDLQFCSEAAEVVSNITKDPSAIGIINEPQATIAIGKNPKLHKVIDMTSNTVTGVTVVTDKYLENHKSEIDKFIIDHKKSVDWVKANPELASNILIDKGVIATGDYVIESINNCNIVCITGKDIKPVIETFFNRIELNLPDNNFYYEG